MKFEQQSVSDKYATHWKEKSLQECNFIEINTLEDLLEYVEKENDPVIISKSVFYKHAPKDCQWSLETYDDYRE